VLPKKKAKEEKWTKVIIIGERAANRRGSYYTSRMLDNSILGMLLKVQNGILNSD